MTDRANKPEAWSVEAAHATMNFLQSIDWSASPHWWKIQRLAKIIAEAHAAHCKEGEDERHDVCNSDVGTGTNSRHCNSSPSIPEVSGMTAQELYKVWLQEHADDLRGDWPIRFADYCLAELEKALKKYGRHLSTCNVNKQELWDEAQAALSQCEMDEGTSCAIAEIAVKRAKCDCGFESALSAAPSAAQPEKEEK